MFLKAITDLAQKKLGEDQLLYAMTTEHFWKSLVSVAAELLRHNDMGYHCSSRLVVPKIGILGTKFCNESWYKVGIDGLHCSMCLENFKGFSNGYVGRNRRWRQT
jgi:hypothetical protein